ncbi:hypothetical protein [Undibacterium sp.]|uniref:hypothetical protein n=1 Tax=Undibacterium sp. TaxID=1914977 RepID=UPI00374CD33A
MSEDLVLDEELLYRSVQNRPETLFPTVEGKLRFSSTVFNDAASKISVDRASLRESAEDAKLNNTDGIVALYAHEIRGIGNIAVQGDKPPNYSFDVFARPIPLDNPDNHRENLAHAQIEASPDFVSPTRFRKLKEALARIVGTRPWVVEPS